MQPPLNISWRSSLKCTKRPPSTIINQLGLSALPIEIFLLPTKLTQPSSQQATDCCPCFFFASYNSTFVPKLFLLLPPPKVKACYDFHNRVWKPLFHCRLFGDWVLQWIVLGCWSLFFSRGSFFPEQVTLFRKSFTGNRISRGGIEQKI